ncbi:hypothetical protein HON52_01350 [Candidatus Uhrbacteria bacterium]|jgi:hypothetical protein|nr:hypothetical protein [Candidatus Uhrbacteria bacterium]
MSDILKTGFHTSLLSYALFFFADYMRPGFVSITFSVHWFLLTAIIFGILWTFAADRAKSEKFLGRMWRWIWQLVFGLLLFMMVWQAMSSAGDLRIFVALVGFLLPWIVIRLLSYER